MTGAEGVECRTEDGGQRATLTGLCVCVCVCVCVVVVVVKVRAGHVPLSEDINC